MGSSIRKNINVDFVPSIIILKDGKPYKPYKPYKPKELF